jgi:hypothetical protein
LRRPQVEFGRDRQRGARFDGEFVRPDPVHADGLAKIGAPRQQQRRTDASNRK